MTNYVQIEGIEKVQRVLKRLPDKLKKRSIQKMFKVALKPFVSTARDQVPKDTGTLRKSIGLITGRSKEFPSVHVGPRVKKRRAIAKLRASGTKVGHYGSGGWYGHFVEYGAPKRRRLRKGNTGKTEKNPYMDRSIKQDRPKIERNVMNDLIGFVNKHAKRLAKL